MRLKTQSPRATLRNVGLGAAFVAVAALLPATAASASTSAPATATAKTKPTIVLVHGAWADASSWSKVTAKLQHDGYTVDAVPNPERGVASDSAYLASYLKLVKGPIVLVGHSYGGFVISNAALGNPNVKALVYIDAYVPAKGDTLLSLTAHAPGSLISPAALTGVPSANGVVDTYVKPSVFRKAFANELTAKQAAVLASTQRPLAQTALGEPSGEPAWSKIPSWDLVGTKDNVIPAATQTWMAKRAHAHIKTIKAQHLSMISHYKKVEALIVTAARATS
jgi:pimeloyl-ACP methyl ester carboxylesterase